MILADSFRIPYWDWARLDVQIVPEVALDPDYRPNGPPSTESSKLDYNPLFTYQFPANTDSEITVRPPNEEFPRLTLSKMIGKDGSPYTTTVRYPDPQGKNDNILWKMTQFYKFPGKKRPESSLPVLIHERNLTERTAYILQSYQTYGAMSNDKYRANPTLTKIESAENWGSLEDIHNAVHNLTGGIGDPKDPNGYGGHMASVPNSSFDPIFWLRKYFKALVLFANLM